MSKPTILIRYCPKCHWLLRSAWMAQELLSTFSEDLQSVTLEPSEEAGGFEIIYSGNDLLWERKRDGGFPDVKELKQRVRDRLDPERDLGHLDR